MPSSRPTPVRLRSVPRERIVSDVVAPAAWGNLPRPLTSLIGREADAAAACDLLVNTGVHLLTLTGPGGIGKTRLALRIAEMAAPAFADGVAFVSLASIADPGLVLATIARELGLRAVGSQSAFDLLLGSLRQRRSLLVLDNFEQVLPAATQVATLMAACPDLVILVTSRALLRLSGEQRFPVAPLSLPEAAGERRATGDGRREIEESAAVQLFVARAQALEPAFAVTDDNAASIAAICHRLDGLPLAIELAAARLPMLSPSELLTWFDRILPALSDGPVDAPDRLRTMRQSIAWSYNLLTTDEQALFRRLAIFVGGFTLEAAEWVAGCQGDGVSGESRAVEKSSSRDAAAGPPTDRPLSPRHPDTLTPSSGTRHPRPDILNLVTALCEKSLLQPMPGDGSAPRFTMLEIVRELALELLTASGEAAATREAHAAHYLSLAEAAARDAGRAGGSGWMRRLTAERPNLGAALDWLEQTGRAGAALHLQLSGALWHYWYPLGDLAEGRTRLERALAAAPPGVDPVLRARALRGAGVLAWQSADYARSRERLEAALATYRALGDQTGIAWTLNFLGCLCATLADADQAEAHMTEALAIFRDLHDAVGIASLTGNLGELALAQGQPDLAIARLEAGLALRRDLGDRVGVVRAQVFLGQALLAGDELARAEAVLRDALAAIRDLDYKQILPAALRAVAHLATRRDDLAAAARWYGAADGVMAALGMELPAARRGGHARTVAAVREKLGEVAFAAAWNEGHADPGAVIADALRDRDAAPSAGPQCQDRSGGAHLTARERDVLRLLAKGESDKEIAAALGLSRRTVSDHVTAIRAKLDAPSRTAAAAIAIRAGLL